MIQWPSIMSAMISSRNDIPAHSEAMGIALSSMCAVPIMRWGEKALADCKANQVSDELTEVILGIIISTGFVSNFVQVDYTTGLAHAIYNGFTVLPSTEENGHFHGEVVSYGILVMLTIDKTVCRKGIPCINSAVPSVCQQDWQISMPKQKIWQKSQLRHWRVLM